MEETSQRIVALILAGKKIEAIKLLREETGIGLKEAKDEVDRLSAGLPRAGEQPPSGDGPGDTRDRLDDISEEVRGLVRAGNKIAAIKLVRETTGMGLKEAKDTVEEMTGTKGGRAGCLSALVVLAVAILPLLLTVFG